MVSKSIQEYTIGSKVVSGPHCAGQAEEEAAVQGRHPKPGLQEAYHLQLIHGERR